MSEAAASGLRVIRTRRVRFGKAWQEYKAVEIAPKASPAWLGTTAIACFAFATFGLLLPHVLRPDYAPRFARNGPRSVLGRIAVLLLGVASVGLVISAINPTDVPGAPSIRAGNIHDISCPVDVVGGILAVALLSVSFGGDSR